MPHKHSKLLLTTLTRYTAAAAFTLAGCASDRVIATSDDSAGSLGVSTSQSVARPWKGRCDVDASFTSPTTLSIAGTCQLAHLGRTTVSAIQTIAPGPTGIVYTNTATYTSANGDQLITTNAGIATPNASGLSLLGIETAAGGTGRLENSSGTATLAGAVAFTSPTTTTGSYFLDGTLNY